MQQTLTRILFVLILASLLLSACQPATELDLPAQAAGLPDEVQTSLAEAEFSPSPTRPAYGPGELVDYTAQPGDTLPALAIRFNTTVEEILTANTFIPVSATTMPPGMPMRIPIYYRTLWGSSYQILPDSLFVNGPAQREFDTAAYIAQSTGWLNGYSEYAADAQRSAASVIDQIAQNYSLSPRLLLTLLELQSGGLSRPATERELLYPLGYELRTQRGLYLQLNWAANLLNQGYYTWRRGADLEIELSDRRIERPDPWQNAASVALMLYFNRLYAANEYQYLISAEGFAAVYAGLFGDPWSDPAADPAVFMPGSLSQPELRLPFEPGPAWAYTGGPHTAWGSGEPWAAIDFAPPAVIGGCTESEEWVTAMTYGVVARSENGIVELDLDGDGDPRTGWVIFYLHIASDGRAPQGSTLNPGDPIGHPSCEGGRASGTHVHIARKYNGEWILADSLVPFAMEGWVTFNGAAAYQGELRRFGERVWACDCSNQGSLVRSSPE